MLVLNYNNVDKFVSDQRRAGSDVRWDGWDLVIWKPTHYGFTSTNGAFRNRRWGVETRIVVDDHGTWKVPSRNVKST